VEISGTEGWKYDEKEKGTFTRKELAKHSTEPYPRRSAGKNEGKS
jgi:hypothetical protein